MNITMTRINSIANLINYITLPTNQRKASITVETSTPTLVSVISESTSETLEIKPVFEKQLNFQEAINEFVKKTSKVHRESVNDLQRALLNQEGLSKHQLHLALMIAQAYAKVKPKTMRKFLDKVVLKLTMHDFVPVYFEEGDLNNEFEYDIGVSEVTEIFRKSYDTFTGFMSYTYPMKSDGLKEPMALSFIRKANQNKNYKTFIPGDKNQFPGAGVIIEGLKSKVFPNDFLEKQLTLPNDTGGTAEEVVHKRFRDLMINGEKDLPNTTFGFFRGCIIIRNPEKMRVDNKKFALIVFNDHFQNPDSRMAYLITDQLAQNFLSNPTESITWGQSKINQFDPRIFEDCFFNEIINLNNPAVLGGMDKALPFGGGGKQFYKDSEFIDKDNMVNWEDLLLYERELADSDETTDCRGHIHRTHMFTEYWNDGFPLENLIPFKKAHDEITNCTLYGFSQLHLFNEAFRLYSYGYDDYKSGNKKVKFKEFGRLLDQSIRWKQSQRITDIERPVLVPTPRLSNSGFNEDLVREVGVIDTQNMACYRSRNQKSFMLPGEIFEELDSETRSNWLKFLTSAYKNSATLTYLPGEKIRPIISDLLHRKMKGNK